MSINVITEEYLNMVVIYSNENNPFTLKLLIAANYGKKEVELKTVNVRDQAVPEPKHLPCLCCEGRNLFLANAAAYYLFSPNAEDENTVDEWLEWESTVLAPSIATIFGTSPKSPSKTVLTNCLRTLNDGISSKQSLTGKTIAVCDVVIWCTLYPFYKDNSISGEILADFSNLTNWLKQLESLPQFQKALTLFKITPGTAPYQVLLNSAKYLVSSDGNSVRSGNAVLSPQHSTMEVITCEEIAAVKKSWLDNAVHLPKQQKKEVKPVLPIPGEKNILITSALPYVNNVPHLGNIIGCVLSADVFARFCRLCNYNTLYICGTDEYGTATETKALEEGLTPQQICDKYFEVHNSIYRWFNIGFDYFGRTSTPEQTKITQSFFLELNRNGFMHTQAVEQLLCEKCDRYLADRFVEGGCPHPGCNYEDARGDQCDGCGKLVNANELKNPRCKVCSTAPITKQSDQFFLDLPKLEPLLYHWMEKSSHGWSNNARIIAKSWIREGLKPRCITRDLKWGIPVPIDGYRNKVFYVWFDAPIGYISITERYTKQWEKWWKPDAGTSVSLYQFMAKDNVPFHSVMFPASLLGMNKGFTTVSHIMATEYLNYEDGKFSKSRGIGVFGNDAQNTGIPSDVWRFYLLYVRPESQDSCFSWVDLATKNNSELLNNLGNFVNRAQVFAEKFFNSIVPTMKLNEDDFTLLALCTRELKEYIKSVEKAKLRDGIRHILAISRHGNQYMQSSEPWVLIKGTDEEKERAGTVIGLCCNITYLLATLLFPYMPETSRTIRIQLNALENATVLTPENPEIVPLLTAGHKLGKPSPLFSKIEPARVEELKKQFAGKQQPVQNGMQDVSSLEAAVAKQGDTVRSLKSSGADKSLWQPEVAILLDLKKKLEAAQKANVTTSTPNGISANPEEIKQLQEQVNKQSDKVRSLKSSGAEKSIWQPEVATLLNLKKKLEASQKTNLTTTTLNGITSSPEEIKLLQENLDKQAVLVRNLKSAGAPKTEWQPQVNILLDLKTKFSAATGPTASLPGKKNKK